MRAELPQALIVEVQRHTGFPWWNGEAYAEYKGYPQAIRANEREIGRATDDICDVIEWLRKDRLFAQADRLRTIAGRLARALPDLDLPGDKDLLRHQARGWK
jgi:hypothetical protein